MLLSALIYLANPYVRALFSVLLDQLLSGPFWDVFLVQRVLLSAFSCIALLYVRVLLSALFGQPFLYLVLCSCAEAPMPACIYSPYCVHA